MYVIIKRSYHHPELWLFALKDRIAGLGQSYATFCTDEEIGQLLGGN